GDRLRARDRHPQILGPAHGTLHAAEPGRPPGRRRGELPTAPDRQVHVAGADPGLPRRRRVGRAGRARQEDPQRRQAVLIVLSSRGEAEGPFPLPQRSLAALGMTAVALGMAAALLGMTGAALGSGKTQTGIRTTTRRPPSGEAASATSPP